MKPLDLPQIPKTQSEKKIWLDNIDYLKSVVEEVFKNSNLLEKTNLSFITEEWLEEQEKPKPGELVGLYKTEIEKDFEKTEIEQKVSQEKDRQFKDSSKEIIAQTINLYNDLSNKELINANFNSCFIHGERSVISKSSFSDDTDAHHINFDTFLAEHISSKYKKGISETFFYTKTKTYLLEEKDIFPAIDKLGITKEYIIVGFSQNMDWLQSQSIEGLNEHDYKGISILNFSHSNHHLVGKSFFILKKSDLPNIIHRTIEESEIEKYKLDTIEDELKIYGSVSNLQERDDLLNELKPYHADKDLRKFVLINLALKTEIRWKKNINSVMIKTFSKYQERGVPDKLSDVKK